MMKLLRLFVLALLAIGMTAATSVAQDADVAKAYNEGLAELKAKDYEAAQNAFKTARQLAQQKGESDIATKAGRYVDALYYNIGVGYVKDGNDAKALQYFEAGIEANEGSSSNLLKNHKGRATIIKKQGTADEIMTAWLKVAEVAEQAGQIGELNKALGQAEFPIAQAMEQKQFDDVITYGSTFLESRETANVHFYLAHTYNQRASYEQALEHARKALELESRSGNALAKIKLEEATALEGVGQFEAAVAAYRECQVGPYRATCQYKAQQLDPNTVGQ